MPITYVVMMGYFIFSFGTYFIYKVRHPFLLEKENMETCKCYSLK